MVGVQLSNAIEICGGAYHLVYKTGYGLLTRESHHHVYAIPDGHSCGTSECRRSRPYDPEHGMHYIQPGIPHRQ